MKRIGIAASLVASLTMGFGCGREKGAGEAGQVSAALSFSGSRHDVTAMAFRVVASGADCASAAIASATVSIAPDAGADTDGGAGAGGTLVGTMFMLAPGAYGICATPLADGGGPSAFCSQARAGFVVPAGDTVSITLVSQCTNGPTGGVGTGVVLNDPPQITAVTLPAGAVDTCGPATIAVTASDPNGDPLSYAWSAGGGAGGATVTGAGPTATFAASAAGTYDVAVTVSDGSGASASLTFVVSVAAGTCGH
jgi:hypothetical protein